MAETDDTDDFFELPFQPATAEQLTALRAKHGKIRKLSNGVVDVWVKRPSPAAYSAYVAERADEASHADAPSNFLRSVIAYPEREVLDRTLELLPGLGDDLIVPLLALCGRTGKATHSKS